MNSCAGVTPRDDSDRTQSMGTGGAKYLWRPALKSLRLQQLHPIIFAHTCTPRTSILRWSFRAEPCDDQGAEGYVAAPNRLGVIISRNEIRRSLSMETRFVSSTIS